MLNEKSKILTIKGTWQQFMPKFLFDKRCSGIPQKYRKTCFDQFMKEFSKSARRTRNVQRAAAEKGLEEMLKEYCKLGKISYTTNFHLFKSIAAGDKRFQEAIAIDREKVFGEFMKIGQKAKEEEKENNLNKFRFMLHEVLDINNINEFTVWEDVKSKLKTDPRYHLIKSVTNRGRIFNEFVTQIIEERRKYLFDNYLLGNMDIRLDKNVL